MAIGAVSDIATFRGRQVSGTVHPRRDSDTGTIRPNRYIPDLSHLLYPIMVQEKKAENAISRFMARI
jgi:hypothetical protein